jgi:hypothetical protein
MRRLGSIVLLLAWTAAHAADCNLNGSDDAADIVAGASDCNTNGVPDTCDLFPLSFVESRVAAGSMPGPIAAAELNGDGTIDVAVANRDAATVTVLANAGDGTFTNAGTFAVGTGPEALAAGVLIGGPILSLGSDVDLVVANGDANTVSVLRNDGSGGFANITGSPFATTGHPNGVAIGDLNNDDVADVVLTRRDANGVSVMVNNGMGDFSMVGVTVFATGMAPRDVVLGDLDADGNTDALVANRGSGTVSYLRNNLGISFFPQVPVASVGDPVGLALADLDADADLDFAVLSTTDASVHVYVNGGAGTFTIGPVVPAAGDGAALRLLDVDGTGTPDLVTVGTSGDAVVLALNDGAGGFHRRIGLAVGDGPLGVAAGDVDRDGRTDLLAADALSAAVSVLRAGPAVATDCDAGGQLDICEAQQIDCNANGVGDVCDGVLRPSFDAARLTTLLTTDVPLLAADVTGDQRADAVLRFESTKLLVARGMPDGSLESHAVLDLPASPTNLLLLDVDGDDDRDYVVASGAGNAVYTLRNGGDGLVTTTDTYALTNTPRLIVAGDVTADGGLDLVVSHADADSLRVLAGTGLGIFAPSTIVALGGRAVALVAGDVDGDTDLDLVALLLAPGPLTSVQVLRNDAGTLVAQAPILVSAPFTLLSSLVGGDVDGDGDLDLLLVEVNALTGVRRLRVAANAAGTYALGQSLPLGGLGVVSVVLPGNLGTAALADLDRDGHVDLALPELGTAALVLFRGRGDGTFDLGRVIPVGGSVRGAAAGDVTGDGALDLLTALRVDADEFVAVVPGLGRPDVDVDADGVSDCREENRCGDCADDEGDALVDLADGDCAAGASLTVRKVVVQRAKGGRPARAKLLVDVPVSLTLDPAATGLGMTFATITEYCGTPALRPRGKRLRLAAADRALAALTVQTLKGGAGLRLKATLDPLDVATQAGDVVRVWLTAAGQSFRGDATLARKGKKLVGTPVP